MDRKKTSKKEHKATIGSFAQEAELNNRVNNNQDFDENLMLEAKTLVAKFRSNGIPDHTTCDILSIISDLGDIDITAMNIVLDEVRHILDMQEPEPPQNDALNAIVVRILEMIIESLENETKQIKKGQ